MVRLVSTDGEQLGIVTLDDALKKAKSQLLDLVEIAPQSKPPVCKILDYGKHVFEAKKQKAASKKKQKQTQVKEIKFRPGTDIGDYQVKLRNLIRFLEAGDKVKITLRFRGREMAHQDLGMEMLTRVREDLSEIANVEHEPKMEGRQLILIMAPKSKKR